jgi:hypothetical protein
MASEDTHQHRGDLQLSPTDATEELCWRKSAECLVHAQQATNTMDKARWLELADSWQALAHGIRKAAAGWNVIDPHAIDAKE